MNSKGCNDIQHLIVDALFGDLEADASTKLQAHMDQCPACAQMFSEMQSTLQVTREVPDDLPSEMYWIGFQERLEERIQADGHHRRLMDLGGLTARLQRALTPSGHPRFSPVFQLAIAIILVFAGVLIGRYGFTGSAERSQIASNNELDAAAVQAMQVAAQTESYLNRSSILLLGLVNHDAAVNADSDLNFEHKRRAADKLVQEAAVLKASLSQSKEAQLLRLINELEKILLQISNLELQEDMPGIEMIQEGIEGRSLLLKINLETMKLMDQPASTPTNELTL